MLEKIRKYVLSHKIETLLIVVIILIAAFLRLYRIGDYMTFLGDEGRDAIIAKEILSGDFTLLGPRASAGDFFLGPIYYYMMAPFLLLSNYDPVGPAVMVALFGIATVLLVYIVGRKIFDIRAGLIGAALYAVSPLVIAYSRSSWNPNPMPFFSLVTLYTLLNAVRSQKIYLFIFTGFLLGIAMQLHYLSTFLAVIIFFFVLIGEFLISKKRILYRYVRNYLSIFAGFILGFSPFLLFEVRHGFPNLRTIFGFITEGNQENIAPNYSFFGNIWDVFYRLFARLITKYPPPEQVNVTESSTLQFWMVATILLAIASIISMRFIKDKLVILLLGLWLFIGVVLFGFYSKSIYDYYLGFMFPLPFLLLGNFLTVLWKGKFLKNAGTVISIILISLLLIHNLLGNPFRNPPNKQKDQAKTIAEFVISKTDNKPFNFALLTRGNSDHVYRYFFETANKAPITIENPNADPERKSVTDQLLIVCEYQECQPLGNPLWEVAGFGRARIDGEWSISFVKVYRLVHYERPSDYSLAEQELSQNYNDESLKFSFKYPESFTLRDITQEDYPNERKPYLRLNLETPDVPDERKKESGFDKVRFENNTMRAQLLIEENTENYSIEEYIDKKTANEDQETRGQLRVTTIPKEGSFILEGLKNGIPTKRYYFSNQNYVYEFTLTGGESGALYSQAAKNLSDEIVKSFEFK